MNPQDPQTAQPQPPYQPSPQQPYQPAPQQPYQPPQPVQSAPHPPAQPTIQPANPTPESLVPSSYSSSQQQPVPQAEVAYVPPSESVEAIRASNKKKTVWGIICLTVPTLVFIIAFVIAIISAQSIPSADPPSTPASSTSSGVPENLFGDQDSPAASARSGANIAVYLLGAFTVLTWLPGIIVGIILLSKRKKV